MRSKPHDCLRGSITVAERFNSKRGTVSGDWSWPNRFRNQKPKRLRWTILEAERFLIESNRQRVKTKAQRLREFKRLKEIEEVLAKERKREGARAAGSGKDSAKLRTPSGRAVEKAASTAGLKPRTAEKGLAVLNKADAGDPKAKELLESIDKNEISVHHAYREHSERLQSSERSQILEKALRLALS